MELRLIECIYELSQTNSNLDKVAVLRRYPDLEPFFTFYADPLKKTYVTFSGLQKYRLKTKSGAKREKLVAGLSLMQLIDALSSRSLSGDMAKAAILEFANRAPKAYFEPMMCDTVWQKVLCKDIGSRLGKALIREAYQHSNDAKPQKTSFSVALAQNLQEHRAKFHPETDRWLISRKYDGMRVIVRVERGGTARVYSRNGAELPALSGLASVAGQCIADSIVLDGEIIVEDEHANEDFRQTVSQAKRKSQVMAAWTYVIFDALTLDEFDTAVSSRTWGQRRADCKAPLKVFLERCQTSPTKAFLIEYAVFSAEAYALFQQRCSEGHWEGLMLRKDAPYKGKRTTDLLKDKSFQDAEYVIEGIETGPYPIIVNGMETTTETAVSVQISHKGYPVRVGSGFTLEERALLHKYPKKFIGTVITVQYFGESQDKTGKPSLRFPTVKVLHGVS